MLGNVAGEPVKGGIEIGHVLVQALRRVALRIDRDEVNAHGGCRRPLGEFFLDFGQLDERERANVRTVRVAEIEERPMTREVLRRDLRVAIVDELERAERLRRRQHVAADLESRLWRGPTPKAGGDADRYRERCRDPDRDGLGASHCA